MDFLRSCHRQAPFLFFNGNTFADVGRQIAAAVFSDLSTPRRRQVMSAVAHYIAGVLDREAMVGIVDSVWFSATAFAVGDRVATPRGSLAGTVIALLPDGRIRWRADTGTELLSLPESLVREPVRP